MSRRRHRHFGRSLEEFSRAISAFPGSPRPLLTSDYVSGSHQRRTDTEFGGFTGETGKAGISGVFTHLNETNRRGRAFDITQNDLGVHLYHFLGQLLSQY